VARILAATVGRQYRQKLHGASAPLSLSRDCLVASVDQVSVIDRQDPADFRVGRYLSTPTASGKSRDESQPLRLEQLGGFDLAIQSAFRERPLDRKRALLHD